MRTPEAVFRTGALPVVSSGVTLADGSDGTPQHYPTVQVDTRRRPDVADLPRVHALDGPGRVRTHAKLLAGKPAWWSGRRADLLRLDVEVTSPVVCSFGVVLDIARHRQLLTQVVESHSLVIATSPPETGTGARWLAVSLDGAVIQSILDEVDARSA